MSGRTRSGLRSRGPGDLSSRPGARFFATTLIFESPQVPEQFVLTVHPHGVIPVTGMLIWGSTQSHGYHPDHFGGSNAALSLPFFRQFLLWNGGVSATKKVVAETLAKAKSFSIFSGGINEMAATRAGCDTVVLTPRVGVIRLAKGAREICGCRCSRSELLRRFDRFPPPDASWVRWLSRQLRVAIMYPVGRWWLPVPMFSRITIVFGAPMDTSTKSAEEVHVEWVEWFKRTHAKYRTLAGCADRELVVL